MHHDMGHHMGYAWNPMDYYAASGFSVRRAMVHSITCHNIAEILNGIHHGRALMGIRCDVLSL